MAQRVLDLTDGVVMVVTDLHGDGEAYNAYRDAFLRLREQGKVDRLIFCGDLVHGIGPAHADRSLYMLLDVIRLQEEYGTDTVVLLLGNHELPHLYGFPLSRGGVDYTPRFEAALTAAGSTVREQILGLIDRLPFFVRTAAGVMLAHCGAAPLAAMPGNRDTLMAFDHQQIIGQVDRTLASDNPEELRREYERMTGLNYNQAAQYYLGVTSAADPRYLLLLRNLLWNRDHAGFNLLWDTLFTRNEQGMNEDVYDKVLTQFLDTWSKDAPARQSWLISGHIPVRGGYQVVCEKQLRLASWAHANPHQDGLYLMFDSGAVNESMADLTEGLRSVWDA